MTDLKLSLCTLTTFVIQNDQSFVLFLFFLNKMCLWCGGHFEHFTMNKNMFIISVYIIHRAPNFTRLIRIPAWTHYRLTFSHGHSTTFWQQEMTCFIIEYSCPKRLNWFTSNLAKQFFKSVKTTASIAVIVVFSLNCCGRQHSSLVCALCHDCGPLQQVRGSNGVLKAVCSFKLPLCLTSATNEDTCVELRETCL